MGPEGRSSDDHLDPVYLHARRETLIIVGLCFSFLVYTLAVCALLGYDTSPQQIAVVGATWGMPTWAFWGLLVPWLAVNVFTFLFCFVWMKDDDLTDANEESMLQQQVALMGSDEPASSGNERGDA